MTKKKEELVYLPEEVQALLGLDDVAFRKAWRDGNIPGDLGVKRFSKKVVDEWLTTGGQEDEALRAIKNMTLDNLGVDPDDIKH